MDLNKVKDYDEEVDMELRNQFTYHPWTPDQLASGERIRDILIRASATIIANVPPCPDRSTALRKIREARMDCNSAITHNGKY